MPDTLMTHYPRTAAAQKKFDKCKKGDVVWFTGGYTIAGDWQSFGRRAKVVDIRTGARGGVIVKPDNDPSEPYCLSHLITKSDILATLSQCASKEEEEGYLKNYQLLPGDLAEEASRKEAVVSTRGLTKAQLIERVRQLEEALAACQGSGGVPG